MPEQAVRVRCPNLMCRKILAVPETTRGKTVKCKNCQTALRVPVRETGGTSKPKAAS